MNQRTKKDTAPQSKDGDAGRGNNWLEGYVPYQLYCLTNRLDRRLQTRLRKSGIKPSPWRIMTVLRSHGTLAISSIVEYTLMEQPTVSRVIVQLETDGLIERVISPEDSRVTLVTLTPGGVEKIDAIIAIAHRNQDEALSDLSRDEIAQFRSILARIEQNIDLHQ